MNAKPLLLGVGPRRGRPSRSLPTHAIFSWPSLMKMHALTRALVALAFPVLTLDAQSVPDSVARHAESTFGFWLGAAPASTSGVLGHAVGSNLALVAVRWTHTLEHSRSYAVDYVADVLPAVFVSMPRPNGSPASGSVCQPGQTCLASLSAPFAGQRAVYGAGAMPLGVQLRLAPGAHIQPFVAAAGGMVWFADRIPDADAARLNFAAEAGAGAVVALTPRLGLLMGYKFHHLSNGGTAPSNVGVDNHLLYVGIAGLTRRD